ncbi:magnesium/cobalt transporter CorA [Desulfolutivibrio sulfoxidireducens]|uniref:magnesium/cobalt transporter CorA n=1 Tax=Desulfolutivibrio sulfoxidireducens TaxID=2773299 RepID=UPI00159DCB73|nr:magnesium/cobalt transporter CorA [Desulfolutivibrio sulfoxidireducens]
MRHRLKKMSRQAGKALDALEYTGDVPVQKTRVTATTYGPDGAETAVMTDREIPRVPSGDGPGKVWIDVAGLSQAEEIRRVGGLFGVHPLILEDIVQVGQRPKIEDLEDYLFVIVKAWRYDGSAKELFESQVSFILGQKALVTFREADVPAFEAVRTRIASGKGRIRNMGADYLLYALLDSLVDEHFLALEKVGEDIEDLGDKLLSDPRPTDLETIHKLKRETIYLRKSVWPLREVVSHLADGESALLRPETRLYFRDLYEHVIQIMDTVEGLLDIVGGMVDIYLSTISFRLNAIMKVLTLISTLFMPMTFVAGVYGMNFKFMPELSWPLGYPMAIGIMLLMSGGLFTFFKLKKWI